MRIKDVPKLSKWERRRHLTAAGDALLIMLPLAMLGNFMGDFFERGDWVRASLALLAALALVAVFFLQYRRR